MLTTTAGSETILPPASLPSLAPNGTGSASHFTLAMLCLWCSCYLYRGGERGMTSGRVSANDRGARKLYCCRGSYLTLAGMFKADESSGRNGKHAAATFEYMARIPPNPRGWCPLTLLLALDAIFLMQGSRRASENLQPRRYDSMGALTTARIRNLAICHCGRSVLQNDQLVVETERERVLHCCTSRYFDPSHLAYKFIRTVLDDVFQTVTHSRNFAVLEDLVVDDPNRHVICQIITRSFWAVFSFR